MPLVTKVEVKRHLLVSSKTISMNTIYIRIVNKIDNQLIVVVLRCGSRWCCTTNFISNLSRFSNFSHLSKINKF